MTEKLTWRTMDGTSMRKNPRATKIATRKALTFTVTPRTHGRASAVLEVVHTRAPEATQPVLTESYSRTRSAHDGAETFDYKTWLARRREWHENRCKHHQEMLDKNRRHLEQLKSLPETDD